MNKQEFQQKIKNMEPPKNFTFISAYDAYEKGFEKAKGAALFNSYFLDEPEKPIVPQFVADMIIERKKLKQGIVTAIRNLSVFKEAFAWISENEEAFAKAWLYGYEVEKEKLYTVEFPNPNSDNHLVLRKNLDGKVCVSLLHSEYWRGNESTQLTEAEIKEDFDWAWQFAEEVEK